MLSRTSFFDPMLARKGIRRTIPLWITHFIIWVMAMPVMLANVIGYDYGAVPNLLEVSEYVYMTVYVGGTLMACFFCAVIAGVLNNYLMAARSTSFYHSLPVKRSAIYCTHLIVTLGVVLIPAAVVGLMTWLVELSMGIAGGIYILKWWGVYALMCLFFTGFAQLCIHITGHVAAAPIIYAILNFTAVAVEYVIRYIPTLFLYGVSNTGTIRFTWLSPIWHIYSTCEPHLEYERIDQLREPVKLYFQNVDYLVGLAVVGVLMMGLAWVLYRMRHSEHAGEFVAIRPLRPVFKYCVTLGFTLILSIVLYAVSYMARSGEDDPSAIWFTVCMLVAGAIGYFGSEMLLQKTFRVWKKGLPGFAVCAALICLGGAALQFDLFGIETYIPDADKVAHLEVNANYRDYNLKLLTSDASYADAIALHQMIVENKETNRYYRSIRYNGGPVEAQEVNYMWVRFSYVLQDESIVYREYLIPAWKYEVEDASKIEDTFGYRQLLNRLHSDPVLVRRAFSVFFEDAALYDLYYVSVYPNYGKYDGDQVLSNAMYGVLRTAVRLDIENGTLLEDYDAYDKTMPVPENSEEYSLSMEFENIFRDENDSNRYKHHYFTVTPEAKHTYAILSDPDSYVTQEQYDREMAIAVTP